jgi:hypothetical protein
VDLLLVTQLAERLDDGGWNCERANGSTRSSFAATINVLEGLLEYERAAGGTAESREARKSGDEYLLKRNLSVTILIEPQPPSHHVRGHIS